MKTKKKIISKTNFFGEIVLIELTDGREDLTDEDESDKNEVSNLD